MFWLKTEPTPRQASLYDSVLAAHAACVWRENASTVALLQAAGGSGCYSNAIAAALMSLGGNHAPLRQTHAVLVAADPAARARSILAAGRKVPGWGSSFAVSRPDSHWAPVSQRLRADFPETFDRVAQVTRELHRAGKCLFPNPSAWTAAAGLALELPPALLPYLFLQGRLPAWSQLVLHTQRQETESEHTIWDT